MEKYLRQAAVRTDNVQHMLLGVPHLTWKGTTTPSELQAMAIADSILIADIGDIDTIGGYGNGSVCYTLFNGGEAS